MRDAALLCCGMMLLVLMVLVLNSTPLINHTSSQPAATWLGDQQGVPPGYTGQAYPDYTYCYEDVATPWCTNTGGSNSSPWVGMFYSGIFSVHPAGSAAGESAYVTSTYNWQTANTYAPDVDLGPSNVITDCSGKNGCTVTYDCSIYPNVPPGDSYNAANPASYNPNTGNEDCYGYKLVPPQVTSSLATAGSAPTVAPGSQLTLEWSCLPSHGVEDVYRYHCGVGGVEDCQANDPEYNITVSNNSSGSGQGFSASGLTGSQTITAPASAGTYTYSLQCTGGGWNLTTMSIPVTVTAANPCPNAAYYPWANGIIDLQHGTTVNINAGGYNFCATNSSPNDIIIGAGSSDPTGQVGSFKNAAPRIGVSTF